MISNVISKTIDKAKNLNQNINLNHNGDHNIDINANFKSLKSKLEHSSNEPEHKDTTNYRKKPKIYIKLIQILALIWWIITTIKLWNNSNNYSKPNNEFGMKAMESTETISKSSFTTSQLALLASMIVCCWTSIVHISVLNWLLTVIWFMISLWFNDFSSIEIVISMLLVITCILFAISVNSLISTEEKATDIDTISNKLLSKIPINVLKNYIDNETYEKLFKYQQNYWWNEIHGKNKSLYKINRSILSKSEVLFIACNEI